MKIQRVCVYCASSNQCNKTYLESAWRLGVELAKDGLTIIYGGGKAGLMGHLADGALSKGGKVIGILPRFMDSLEWGHKGITELRIVDDLQQRNRMMIYESDAFVVLPGGCGTIMELIEVITWKRLGLHTKPIIIVNLLGFYNPCIEQLEKSITEKFMDERHRSMWTIINSIDEVIDGINNAPKWSDNAIEFAKL